MQLIKFVQRLSLFQDCILAFLRPSQRTYFSASRKIISLMYTIAMFSHGQSECVIFDICRNYVTRPATQCEECGWARDKTADRGTEALYPGQAQGYRYNPNLNSPATPTQLPIYRYNPNIKNPASQPPQEQAHDYRYDPNVQNAANQSPTGPNANQGGDPLNPGMPAGYRYNPNVNTARVTTYPLPHKYNPYIPPIADQKPRWAGSPAFMNNPTNSNTRHSQVNQRISSTVSASSESNTATAGVRNPNPWADPTVPSSSQNITETAGEREVRLYRERLADSLDAARGRDDEEDAMAEDGFSNITLF